MAIEIGSGIHTNNSVVFDFCGETPIPVCSMTSIIEEMAFISYAAHKEA